MTTERPNRHKLLVSFFITYFIVLIIPICSLFSLYYESISIIRSDTDDANHALMTQASAILDSHVKEINRLGMQIIQNPSVTSIRHLEKPLEYPNVQQVFQVKSALTDYTANNDLIYDYFLCYDNGQLVLNDRIAYSYADFWDYYMHPANASREKWLNGSGFTDDYGKMHSFSMVVLNEGEPFTREMLGFTFNLQPIIASDCHLMIYLEYDKVVSLLDGFRLEDGAAAYIETAGGQVIAGSNSSIADINELRSFVSQSTVSEQNRFTVNGTEMLVSSQNSDDGSYRIVIARPSAAVYKSLISFRLVIFLSTAVGLVIAILVGILFARRNSKLLSIVAHANNKDIEGLTYGAAVRSLGEMVDDMRISNDNMATALEKQKPYLLSSFLLQLLNGDFRSEEDAAAIASGVSNLDPAKGMCAVFFHYNGCDDNRDAESIQAAFNCCEVVRHAIERTEGASLHTRRFDDDYVMLISGDRLEERIDALAKQIRTELPEEVNRRLYIIAGSVVHKLTEVVRSLDNALSLMYISTSPSEIPVLYYVESANDRARIFYPQDLQHHLISCIMSGDEEGMLSLLRELKEKNLQSTRIPNFMGQLFIDSLLNTLLQAVNMVGFPPEKIQQVYDRVKALMTLPVNNQLSEIDVLFVSLCSSVVQMKNARQQVTIDEICEYIRNNYTDVNLSLTSVADRFGISESYLSGTFKAQSGANFFTYVEMLRMNKAKELLRNTNLKIGEIAEHVGYASANSFCRAFRRSTNSSATDYRNGID